MSKKKGYSHSIQCYLLCLVIFLSIFHFLFSACDKKESPDPTPTPTYTATPTITPTPTPTGNIPELVYPINDVSVSGDSITFDWTDVPGATRYWLACWIWYPPDSSGTYLTVWNEWYMESTESQLTLSKEDIWFYYEGKPWGWQSTDYAWIVTSDTSLGWSPAGTFHWNP